MGNLIKEFLSLSSPAALTKKLIFVLVSKGKELVTCSIYTPHLLQTNPPKNQIYPHSTQKTSAPFVLNMGFDLGMKIAVLDFLGNLIPCIERLRWKTLTREVRDALEGPGYFEVVYDIAVPESLQKEMSFAIKELFDLPQET
ncbi:hypothetical protein AMTRI_Chr11g96930 [Amborella trichopoda]|uniref:Uncharacterized protein n=1 Tax=Amborella trichopoda TaxID=13333 RepID=U5D9U2_AMBTC|nr:hypothetical protein AMTR_s00054p00201020 [Amborella trichopoda]